MSESPRPPIHRHRAPILGGLFLCLPVVALLAPLGIAPLGILIALACLGLTWIDRPWTRLDRPVMLCLLALVTLAALSSSWSPDTLVSLKASLQLAALILCLLILSTGFACLDQDELATIALGVLAGLVITILLILADRLSAQKVMGWLHHLTAPDWQDHARSSTKRGSTVMAILVWPVIAILWRARGWKWALAAFVLALSMVGLGYSRTAQAAFAIACLAFGLTWLWPRLVPRLMAVLVVLATLILPWTTQALPPPQALWDQAPWIPNSLHHRLTIWQHSMSRAAEKPLLGWGMDASRLFPEGEDQVPVHRVYGSYQSTHSESLLPLHPHNMAVQWWLELGLAGALLCSALIALLCLRLAQRSRPLATAGTATVLAAACSGVSAFGAWQSWWLLTLILCFTLLVHPKAKTQS